MADIVNPLRAARAVACHCCGSTRFTVILDREIRADALCCERPALKPSPYYRPYAQIGNGLYIRTGDAVRHRFTRRSR